MNTQPLGWTTIEQSKKLLEAGLDNNTADMYYPYFGEGKYGDTPRAGEGIEFSGGMDIHAWSLGKLIDLMPKCIETKKPKNLYFLDIYPASNGIAYAINGDDGFVFLQRFVGSQYTTTLIEHVVSMVCWLLKKNYLKNGNIQRTNRASVD